MSHLGVTLDGDEAASAASRPGPDSIAGPVAATSILVVIPTLNEAATIKRVLNELHEDLPLTARVRFVVCDGGSTDGTQEIVRGIAGDRPTVMLLHNAKRLQSAAVNLAVRALGEDTDFLVRCDAHAYYPKGYVAKLVASLGANRADAVVVPMDSRGDTCLRRAVAWVSDSIVGSGGSAHRGGQKSGYVDHGHHAAFRMESFVRAGGYDETFTHNEDAELDCRQRALGSRIYLDAGIRLDYLPRGTWVTLSRQYFNYGRGRSRTVRRHPSSLRLRQMVVPIHVAGCMAALAILPWSAWPMLLPGVYVAVLALVGLTVSVKRRNPCGLLCGPAAAVMHVSWAAGLFWGLISLREQPWSAANARPLEPPSVAARALQRSAR
jgi:succinoglycan biosynthesis protein ExoA